MWHPYSFWETMYLKGLYRIRECFMNNLVIEQKKYSVNEKLRRSSFWIGAWKDEVSFTWIYQEIDNIPSITSDDATGSCQIAGYRIYDGAFLDKVLPYHIGVPRKRLSHLLSRSQKLSQKSLSWMLLHENPCDFIHGDQI